MAEYISRQAAIEALRDYFDEQIAWSDDADSFVAECCEETINGIPSADVRENKRGHWTATPTGDYRCSECGYFTVDLVCVEDGEGWVEIAPNYCSRCGAEMKGANDG